jgi:hypothetical protein
MSPGRGAIFGALDRGSVREDAGVNSHRTTKVDPPRPLTQEEHDLLDFLLADGSTRNERLRGQLNYAFVTNECLDCPSIEIEVSGAELAAPGDALASEAEGLEQDGIPFHVLLHTRDGFLSLLDVFREDGNSLTTSQVSPGILLRSPVHR